MPKKRARRAAKKRKDDASLSMSTCAPDHALVLHRMRAWCATLRAQGEGALADHVERLIDAIQTHAPWNGSSRCDGTELEISAALDYMPAYCKGQDDGVAGAVRALSGILDGPVDVKPSFGASELNALAKRLLDLRAQAEAGEKRVQELLEANNRYLDQARRDRTARSASQNAVSVLSRQLSRALDVLHYYAQRDDLGSLPASRAIHDIFGSSVEELMTLHRQEAIHDDD